MAGMTTPQQIAVCRNYDQLRAALAAFCTRYGITRTMLDVDAGIADGHSGKLLGPAAAKVFGRVSLGRVLDALELEIVVQIRADAVLHAEQQKHADGHACENKPASRDWRRSRGRAWGKRMAARRALLLTSAQRRAIARRAAQARWHQSRTLKENG
jgi:hypothetical protein